MTAIARAAAYAAQKCTGPGWDEDKWLEVLSHWYVELQTMVPGSSFATGGMFAVKTYDAVEFMRQVIDVYPDGEHYSWIKEK